MKKLLTLTLSLLMAFSMCLTVSADDADNVAKVGDCDNDDCKYTTLQSAINAAESGDRITILNDVEDINGALSVGEGKNITIDLNGKTISTAEETTGKHYYILVNNGTLVLEDSIGTGSMNSRGIDNYGTLTINSGTYASIDSGNGGASVWNNPNANLIINGGTLSVPNGQDDKKFWNGAQCIYNQYGNVKIYGGTITSNSTVVYAIISVGDLTISPAEGKNVYISGQKGGIGINSGNVVINGGTSISGDYYGIYISDDGYKGNTGKSTVVINDCNFDGKNYSVYIGTDDKDRTDSSTLVINGGTYNKPITAANNTVENAITVKGGTFSNDVSEYLAEDYNVVKLDGKYNVVSKDTKVDVKENTAAVSDETRDTINTLAANNNVKDKNGNPVVVGSSTEIELNSVPKTLSSHETKKIESVKESVVKELKVDTSKEELKYIPLDITLTAINKVDGQTINTTISELGEKIAVTLYLKDETVNTLKNKSIKIIRIHGDETTTLDDEDVELNTDNKVLTFKTDKFSTYAIVYKDAKKVDKKDESTSSNNTSSDSKVVTCEQAMNSKNWTWSESKKACVYRVSNTSSK